MGMCLNTTRDRQSLIVLEKEGGREGGRDKVSPMMQRGHVMLYDDRVEGGREKGKEDGEENSREPKQKLTTMPKTPSPLPPPPLPLSALALPCPPSVVLWKEEGGREGGRGRRARRPWHGSGRGGISVG